MFQTYLVTLSFLKKEGIFTLPLLWMTTASIFENIFVENKVGKLEEPVFDYNALFPLGLLWNTVFDAFPDFIHALTISFSELFNKLL